MTDNHTQTMQVRKRNGSLEAADVNKIVKAVSRCCEGLTAVDPLRVATKTISGLYDGATTQELDRVSIQTAAFLIGEDPQYSQLAARLLAAVIEKEVENQEIHSFSQSISVALQHGLIAENVAKFVNSHSRKLNAAIKHHRTNEFEYFGLRTLYDRYLVRNPKTRDVLEQPQYLFMRIACGLAKNVSEAIDWYNLFSSLDYVPSSPTLFNAGTAHPQLSSCFLMDSPADNLTSIYNRYTEAAQLSKFAGGIGVSYSRVRSSGSLIKGTNGKSQGIVPFLKTLDASVAAVNQGGKRKGACCVYLETWHADIEDFLDLKDNTGDHARRTHNLNIANWIPDLFMKRVEADEMWTLFDPKDAPELVDLWGQDFDTAYGIAEEQGLGKKRIPARELYGKMMRTLAQTGNGWICFKDPSNRNCNQTFKRENVVHLSNLCTEILEVNTEDETAVCNLGSINLSRHTEPGGVDFGKLRETTELAVRQLNRVIDENFYPVESAGDGNRKWRPVGLGVMGLQDVFFQLGLEFDSISAKRLTAEIAEVIYHQALKTSVELAKEEGKHPAFPDTRIAHGWLHIDGFGDIDTTEDWESLREDIEKYGVRNSLLIAIAPTATIAAIAGCYECIEPQISNLFKRETLSGEFLQINRYLVNDLKRLELWDDEMREAIKASDGSVQEIDRIPESIRLRYRTAWELPQKALIELAAAREPFIDQSQSLNLFLEAPNIGKLSSMYMYAWQQGLKTTYYLRSRPATGIKKTIASSPKLASMSEDAMVACSLENPEICEACQ